MLRTIKGKDPEKKASSRGLRFTIVGRAKKLQKKRGRTPFIRRREEIGRQQAGFKKDCLGQGPREITYSEFVKGRGYLWGIKSSGDLEIPWENWAGRLFFHFYGGRLSNEEGATKTTRGIARRESLAK